MALLKSERGSETINQWAANPWDPGRREGEVAPVGCWDRTERTALAAHAHGVQKSEGLPSQNEDTQPTCPIILSTPSNSTLGGVLRLRTQLSTLGVLSLPSVGVSSSRCYVTLFLPNSFLWSCFLIV